ncbi:MAG: hypothetical protein RQ715_05495 [Methylococcales bacterium]|nr:hypothetical protein [Methylococcales bacterium]
MMRSWLLLLIFTAAVVAFPATAKEPPKIAEATYKQLAKARKAQDKKRPQEALTTLEALLPNVKDKAYEQALTYQHLAFVYLALERYNPAVDALQNALRQADLFPTESAQNLRFNLAQAAFHGERYALAKQAFSDWRTKQTHISADAWYLGALIEFKLNHFAAAEKILKQALNHQQREEWLTLLLHVQLEQKHYPAATDTLRGLIKQKPDNKQHWLNLTDTLSLSGNHSAALDTLKLVEQEFGLTGSEVKRLVNLYLHNNIPYSAAKTLAKAMDAGKIKKTAEQLEWLANSWAAARETGKAVQVLAQVAAQRGDGKLYLRCAQWSANARLWSETLTYTDKALQTQAKNNGQIYLLKGYAALQLNKIDQARAAFRQASGYVGVKQQAKAWLSQLNTE